MAVRGLSLKRVPDCDKKITNLCCESRRKSFKILSENIYNHLSEKMAGNNPRKFKDRIALLNQKQAESTAQFQAVMRDVSEVKKPQPFPTNFEPGQAIGGEGLMIPRHLSPGLPTHHPHYRWVKR